MSKEKQTQSQKDLIVEIRTLISSLTWLQVVELMDIVPEEYKTYSNSNDKVNVNYQEIGKKVTDKKGPLLWDDLAKMLDISPRTFKTYRMPDGTTNHRTMHKLMRRELEELKNKLSKAQNADD